MFAIFGVYAQVAKYIAIVAAVLSVVAAILYGIHVHDEGVRAPLKKEIAGMESLIEAQKAQAAQMLADKIAENEKALANYILAAKESDTEYEKRIADIRARSNIAGMRLYWPGSGQGGTGTGQTGQGGAGTLESPPAQQSRIPDEIATKLLTEAALADEVAVYANSCYAFVNEK